MTGLDSELEQIINGCLNNNRLSQKQLYEKYASRMFGVCRRYANSTAEAEDMLMEGFMNVFRNLGTFKGESSFLSWMHSVMVNTSINIYRSNRRFRNEQLSEDVMDSVYGCDDNAILTDMDAKQVLEQMEQMQETPRIVFNLKEIEGYGFAEIAEMLGKKEGAVRVAYMRARKWLQEAMGK